MGPGPPERPDRLRAIEAALGAEKFKRLEHLIAPFPPREALCRAHPESYLDALEQASPREGLAALDADGQVLEERAVPTLDESEVREAANVMIGAQRQTPPMVSALKVGGRRLHALAREGLEVERAPRDITVSEFSLRATGVPEVWEFDVTCSVGTYVRVLLSDLAARLGTIGHLSSLRRLASGEHDVKEALTLLEFKQALEQGDEVLKSPRLFVTGLEHASLSADEERRVRMGQHLELEGVFQGSEIAAIAEDASLIGVLRRRGEKWKPEVVLTTDAASGSR